LTPSVLTPAQADDLSISGADLRLATAADGRAIVAVRSADGGILVVGADPEPGAPAEPHNVRRWGTPLALEPGLPIPNQLSSPYQAVISQIHAVDVEDGGEAWLVHSRLIGPLGADGSRIQIYLRHRPPGPSDTAWDPAELVANISPGVARDPVPPRVRFARAATGQVAVAWSQRFETPGVRVRSPGGGWRAVDALDTDPRSMDQGSLQALALDAAGAATAAWTRGSELEIGNQTGGAAGGWSVAESVPDTSVFFGANTSDGDIWLFSPVVGGIEARRYSIAAGLDRADITISGEYAPLHVAAGLAGQVSLVYAPISPPLDGPILGLRVTTFAAGIGWSPPRDLATSSTFLNGSASAWDANGEATVVWSEGETGRSRLRYARLDEPDVLTLAEFEGSVAVAAFSSRGQPLVALYRRSPLGGNDFTVRSVR
jgi:hypothetical protein